MIIREKVAMRQYIRIIATLFHCKETKDLQKGNSVSYFHFPFLAQQQWIKDMS